MQETCICKPRISCPLQPPPFAAHSLSCFLPDILRRLLEPAPSHWPAAWRGTSLRPSRARPPRSARTHLSRRFKRDHDRRTEIIRTAIFVGRFPFRLLANSLHKWPHTRPWIPLIPKQKLYLSCKSFSTVGSLAVAQI